MRLGVILPSFATHADEALSVAVLAEEAGLHGLFVYDHLWPLGHPGEPALSSFPVLGAVLARTGRVQLGTLVARVGLLPDEILLEAFATLEDLSGGRLIAGVGTGDRMSAGENTAYGLDFPTAEARLSQLEHVVAELRSVGVETWVGGRSDQTVAIAHRHHVTANLWAVTPERIAKVALNGPVSWAGNAGGDQTRLRGEMQALSKAGASWAVYAWPGSLEPLLDAASAAEIALLA